MLQRDPARPKTFTFYSIIQVEPPREDGRWLLHLWDKARVEGVSRSACWHTENAGPHYHGDYRLVIATWTAFA